MGRRGVKKPRENFTVEVESLDQEGRGVAHREGKAVFIEGALPGELVTYERIRNKKSYESGTVVEVHREGPSRVAPRCPNFGFVRGKCGGCAMQHVDPYVQVAAKQRVLMDALARIGKLSPETILPPVYGPFWGYRHRARLSVRDVAKKGGILVGFHERKSTYVADMHSCDILPKNVSLMIDPLRELVSVLTLRQRLPQVEVAVDGEGRTALVFRNLVTVPEEDLAAIMAFGDRMGADIWLQPGGPDTAAPVRPELRDALGLRLPEFGVRIPFRPTDFTQVNHRMNEVMVGRAVRLLGVEPGAKVVDFFCGLGNFTLPLAKRAARVTGIEGSEALVSRARAGAAENGLAGKTSFTARNLFTWNASDWESLWRDMGGIDRVLLDPPREGAEAVCGVFAVTDLRPARMVYVSCNPATLARDCAILHHRGGWRLRAAGVMNMFPHTGHVESMAVLEPGPKPAVVPAKAAMVAEDGESPNLEGEVPCDAVPEADGMVLPEREAASGREPPQD